MDKDIIELLVNERKDNPKFKSVIDIIESRKSIIQQNFIDILTIKDNEYKIKKNIFKKNDVKINNKSILNSPSSLQQRKPNYKRRNNVLSFHTTMIDRLLDENNSNKTNFIRKLVSEETKYTNTLPNTSRNYTTKYNSINSKLFNTTQIQKSNKKAKKKSLNKDELLQIMRHNKYMKNKYSKQYVQTEFSETRQTTNFTSQNHPILTELATLSFEKFNSMNQRRNSTKKINLKPFNKDFKSMLPCLYEKCDNVKYKSMKIDNDFQGDIQIPNYYSVYKKKQKNKENIENYEKSDDFDKYKKNLHKQLNVVYNINSISAYNSKKFLTNKILENEDKNEENEGLDNHANIVKLLDLMEKVKKRNVKE